MSDPFIGEIRMFGGNFAPNGWELCQGQTMSIADYDTLYNLIGTTYGGDGQETFCLPNLASRALVHQGRDNQSGTTYPLGSSGGQETVSLSINQLPTHSHPLNAANGTATSATPGGNVWASWADGQYSTASTTTTMSGNALTPSGGNQPHENMPPYLAVNFIISMYGIYPSQP